MSWIADWLKAHPAPGGGPRGGVEISYSQMRAFLECPWQYRLRYVDRRRAPMTPASALGVSIHRALEAYHRRNLCAREELLEAYDENWVHAGFSSAPEQLEWYQKGERILETFLKDEEATRCTVDRVESEFFVPLGDHLLRGIIDRIDCRADGTYEVVDYKTHLDIRPEAEVADDLQLGLYGLGAREGFGIEPSWLTVYYVAAGKRVTVPYDPGRDEELKALAARIADIIAARPKYEPDTSFCPSCSLKEQCSRAAD